MGLVAINPGPFTTVQDRGRVGYREWGVPVGGAFDAQALDLANALVGNPTECAALEMTLFGGLYEAQHSLAVALAGAPMAAAIVTRDGRERSLVLPLSCTLEAGERLRVGGTDAGARTYLAVRGGWQTPVRLGSRSDETRLAAGASVPAVESRTAVRHPAGPTWTDPTAGPIRVIDGPDAVLAAGLDDWLSATFRVSPQCDRMGLRMEGPPPEIDLPAEPLSRPVAPGTIQVAGTRLLVLGVACGTMGGYPQVAHVISADLARVGQLRAGNVVRFRRVRLAEARDADHRERAGRAEFVRRLATAANDRMEEP